jgi:hypothetical protein
MKPCKICHEPKGWHGQSYGGYVSITAHEFQMDNLLWIEKQLEKKEREDKHKKLNYCQICKQDKKSPFGICQQCSEWAIKGNL